jgi:hypothetical protein
VTLSVQRPITERVRPPRSLFLRWPLGHALGEPGHRAQQLSVLLLALEVLRDARVPGTIVDAPWPWRRARYEDPLAPP